VTVTKLTPRPEQEETIREILRDKSHLCRAEGGAGKTLIGVEAVLRSHAKITLVVCPLNTFSGWRKTFQRQSDGRVTPRVIDSKKAGQLNFQALASREPGVYVLSWEKFRMYDWSNMPLDFVVLDEVHRQQNRRAGTHEAVLTTRSVPYKLGLSATPWGNHIQGAWATLRWLWYGNDDIVGRNDSFWNWVTRHMHTERNQYSGKKVTGERTPGTVWASLPSKSYFKAPFQEQPIVYDIECELMPAQRKLYDRFEEEAIVWLEDHPLVADVPGMMRLRLREICLAVPSIKEGWVQKWNKDEEAYEKVWGEIVYFEDTAKSTKADAIIDQLNDLYAAEPEPVIIYTHSKKFATMLTARLKAKKFRAESFVGGMPEKERLSKLEGFGRTFDVMVCTIAAIGTGTDGLQDVCSVEFWISLDDNRILNQQAHWRLSRDGQQKTVRSYRFLAADTVEVDQRGKLTSDAAQLDESFTELETAA
jgi:superfamily II DNA or RNA helicase